MEVKAVDYLGMSTAEFLDAMLERTRLTQNELARAANLSHSALTSFRNGKAGVDICIQLAGALRMPLEVVLSVAGHWNYPMTRDQRLDELTSIYRMVDEPARERLLEFARYTSWAQRG